MKKKLAVFLLSGVIVILLLLIYKTNKIQATPITNPDLTGFEVLVKDANTGAIIPDARVEIKLGPNSPETFCTYSDALPADSSAVADSDNTGNYYLGNVCCTISYFIVTVTKTGYVKNEQRFENVWQTGQGHGSLLVNNGQFTHVDMTLTPEATPTPTPCNLTAPTVTVKCPTCQ